MTTNRDKINRMSDKELSELFNRIVMCNTCPASNICQPNGTCGDALYQWLKQESEE